MITLLFSSPVAFLLLVIPLLYSIIAHELAHGTTAFMFGDDTAKNTGRLSLNPLVHLDTLGTISLFLVGFGWARPVPINFWKLKNSKLAIILVSLAGCFTNIIIAIIALFIFKNFRLFGSLFGSILIVIARINIILGSFNLLPIPPLDGSRIVMTISPPKIQRTLASIEPFGFFILIFLLLTGLLEPLIRLIQNMILSLISFIL